MYALHAVGDEASLGVGVEEVAILPSAAVRRRIMATPHDLAREIGRLVDGLTDHERRELHLMLARRLSGITGLVMTLKLIR